MNEVSRRGNEWQGDAKNGRGVIETSHKVSVIQAAQDSSKSQVAQDSSTSQAA